MIKAVALDIFGTVLASDDHDNKMPPRKGISAFFQNCSLRQIPIISSSDYESTGLKTTLDSCFQKWPEHEMNVRMFYDHFWMNQLPVKDFSAFLDALEEVHKISLSPRQLLVIGDSYKDIEGAREQGCPYVHVPEYRVIPRDNFDFSRVDIDKISSLVDEALNH